MATANDDNGMRSGRVAIVGRPNAGKSTLLNALVGTKLAIATSRPGTTRTQLLGVAVLDDPPTQLGLVDTPGLHRPKSALGALLVDEARHGLADVNAVILVIPAVAEERGKGPPNAADREALELAKSAGKPVVLALSKVDKVRDKRALLPVMAQLAELHPFAAVVPVSATRGVQLDALVRALRPHLEDGALFDASMITDKPVRELAAELVREAAIDQTRDEVPHGIAVHVDEFIERENSVRIAATLVVEKESHKGIVLGRGGSKIKAIGTRAREGIEALMDRPVYLELFVRVDPGWTSDPRRAEAHVRRGGEP